MRISHGSRRRQLNGKAQNRNKHKSGKVEKGVQTHTHTHVDSVKCLKNEALKSLASAFSVYYAYAACDTTTGDYICGSYS